MIRYATLDDCMAIEDLFLRAKRRTEFCTVKVDFEKARKNLRRCIQSGMGFAMVAEHEYVSGALCGMLADYWYSNERYATDLAFVSRHMGDGVQLLCRFKAWADARNAKIIMGTTGARTKAMRAVYEGAGLMKVGDAWVGEKPINVPALRSVQA